MDKEETKKWWTVEYSYNQNCYHIERLDCTLVNNMHTFKKQESNDYQILGLFKTQDECSAYIKELKKYTHEKEKMEWKN